MPKESKRQFVHIFLFIFAFFLKYLSQWQVFFILLFFLVFVLVLLPQLKAKSYFYREAEKKYSAGAVLYFLVLMVLVLVFPLPIVAVSWAILALGDGMATLIGRNFRVKELQWNRKKSYAGTIAFVVFGTLGAVILLRWMLPEFGFNSALSLSLKTVIVAAIVESLPWRVNDNISVPIASAVVLNFLLLG